MLSYNLTALCEKPGIFYIHMIEMNVIAASDNRIPNNAITIVECT